MTTLADSDGLLASLFEAGKRYEVHAAKSGGQHYLLACTSRSPDKVEWLATFDTGEHFAWLITVTRDEGTNIRVTIDGEHWKLGSLQTFTFLFDRSTGKPR
jgi:hypothetical protein